MELVHVHMIRFKGVSGWSPGPSRIPLRSGLRSGDVDMVLDESPGIADLFIVLAVSNSVMPPSYAFLKSFAASSLVILWIGSAPNPFC